MKKEIAFWIVGCILILILLTSCGDVDTALSESAPTATPIPATDTPVPPTNTPAPATRTPTPLPQIDLDMEMPEGDLLRGQNVALTRGCYGCHVNWSAGPPFNAVDGLPIITKRGELRIADSAYKGKATTNQGYLIESIFLPAAYIVPGEWEDPMPTTFYYQITEEELADLMAWLNTFE